MDAYIGQIIQHPIRPSLQGTITSLTTEKDKEYVMVNWHDGTTSSLYAALVEAAKPYLLNPQNLKVGDDVVVSYESPIETIGQITSIDDDGKYCTVHWNDKYGFTTEDLRYLNLFKREAEMETKQQIVDFLVGERVFYKYSILYPLGVVEYIEEVENNTVYHVRWDSGLYSVHSTDDISSCAVMITHLSQSVPELKGI